MPFLPKHPVSRAAALFWLSACVTVLITTLLQNGLYTNERSALAMMVLVYFLGFPSAHVAVLIISKIKLFLYLKFGFEPDILTEGLCLWMFTVILGYVQWFVLLPWLSRKCWQLCGALFNRGDAAARTGTGTGTESNQP